MAMVSNSIAPWASKLADPLVASILRYLDRGFKKHLKKKTNLLEEAAEKAKLQKKGAKVQIDKPNNNNNEENDQKKESGDNATPE